MKTIQSAPLLRSLALAENDDGFRAAIDEEARTVEVAFASEVDVDRGWWTERLVVSRKACDLDRLNTRAAVLADHNRYDQIGVVEKAWIDKDKVARAILRFSDSEKADQIFREIVAGIRSHVSVGYRIHEMVLAERTDDGPDIYRIESWTPFEISIVSVPADYQMSGVGREADFTSQNSVLVRGELNQVDDVAAGDTTTIKENRDMSDQVQTPAVDVDAERSAAANEATSQERTRSKEIRAIAAKASKVMPEAREMADQYVDDGRSVDQFRAAIVDKLEEVEQKRIDDATGAAEIGMSEREVSKYSITRAIRCAGDRNWSGAEFEREMSDEVAKMMGREHDSNRFSIPFEVIAATATRDLTATVVGHTGDKLIGTEHRADLFVEMLRNTSVLGNMGATVLAGLRQDQSIPRQDSGASFAFIDNETYSGSDNSQPGFSAISLTPHTLRGRVNVTRKMVLQSTPHADMLVMNDIREGASLAVDKAGIYNAGGTNDPQCLIGATSVGVVSCGTNGGAIDWGKLIDLQTSVRANNAGPLAGQGYVCSANVEGNLRQTPIDTSGNNIGFLMDNDGRVAGRKCLVSNQLPDTFTSGSHTDEDLGAIIYGAWPQFILAMWGGYDIQVDPFALADKGGIVVRIFVDVDFGLRHPEAFCTCTNIII